MITILSVVLRLLAVLYLGNAVETLPGVADQTSYHMLAQRVIEGHGLTFDRFWWPYTQPGAQTGMWSYFYTLYLTAIYTIFGPNPLAARIIQAVIVGVLHPTIAFLLGREVFGRRAGLLAAAFTAVYIYFVYYAATLMTEPFYITGILAALYLFLRIAVAQPRQELRLAVALGVVLGATVLLRQLFLLIIPFLLLWLWSARFLASRRITAKSGQSAPGLALRSFFRSRRAPLLPTAVIIGLIALMILPFTLYNASRFDRFVLLNTNAGYAFFWANHPIYGIKFLATLPPEIGSYQELIPAEFRGLDEPALEQALMNQGVRFVIDDPVRYVLLTLSRIPVYFKFWPSSESGLISNISRVGSFGLFLPLMVAGLVYSLAHKEVRQQTLGNASLLLLFAGIYTGIHLLSWSLIRYRLPVDAILLIYAGLAGSVIWAYIESRRLPQKAGSSQNGNIDGHSGVFHSSNDTR